MIPEPEFKPFRVGGADHLRVIIASDGVWDFVTPEKAAAVVRAAASPQKAADALVAKAVAASKSRLNRLKDDCTCVVVEVNPQRQPFSPPPKERKKHFVF